MGEFVHSTIQDGAAVVTIDRPKALNALNSQVLQEIYEVMDLLEQDETVFAVVLRGAGEKAFVAGADIASMQSMDSAQITRYNELGHRAMNRVASMTCVTIAAIQGYALGGGCELALACDIRVAASNARLGFPEVTLGVIPGFGGTQRLPRLVGRGRAIELITTGRHCSAREGFEIGLVDQLVEPCELMTACMDLAKRITSNSGSAVWLAKWCINGGSETDLHSALKLEQNAFLKSFDMPDRKEGMGAFLEKRKPRFQKAATAAVRKGSGRYL